MYKNNILTPFSFKWIGIIGFMLLLAGCSTGAEGDLGFFQAYFVQPFTFLLQQTAGLVNGSYGVAIILITVVLRLIIMPFMVKQQKDGQRSQGIMAKMKPELDAIQAEYKQKKSTTDQLAMQKELAKVYEKYEFNPAQMLFGCLPLLIQMPFLIGFYYAIRQTPEIAVDHFLWFSLGEIDFIIVAIAVIVYFFQAKVNLLGTKQDTAGMMKPLTYFSPIMIGIIGCFVPSALTLYWAVAGTFIIVQTYITKKFILKQI